MNTKEHIAYWLKTAAHDLETAETLFESQRYDWCLFLGHLVIEKALKAHVVKDNPSEVVPWIHNLTRLAKKQNYILQLNKKLCFLK